MENASKALIIAGAILLSILLISLGIMIFNQAQDTVSDSGMSEAQITAFNNKFIKYEGSKKGTMVKSLIQEVIATNAQSSSNDSIQVAVKMPGSTTAITTGFDTSSITANKTYTVKITGYTNGRISEITITG